jgi:hypothetical protein
VLAESSRRRRDNPRETGAVAVEFALLLPLLMMFLFGIVQYGFGLYQLQAFTATVADATQKASTGITSCGTFSSELKSLAAGNGLDGDDVTHVDVEWLTESGGPSAVPDLVGQVRVTATFTPFRIGIPFVPFPETISRTQSGTVQNIITLNLPGCDVDV